LNLFAGPIQALTQPVRGLMRCRYAPQSDPLLRGSESPLCAIFDQSAAQQKMTYAITSRHERKV